jgi:dihydroorotate dehydrogenase
MGINFPNLLGLGAGLDKNGDYIDALGSLGFGFIEIGTVTPLPQPGNPKPRLFRLKEDQSIINRMGFNNKGVDYLVSKVKKSNFQKNNGILGINIGKNATTPIEKAVDDYLICLNKVYEYASYIVINISSPNTKNLRDLQSQESLDILLQTLMLQRSKLEKKHNKYVPLVIKISPDLINIEIKDIANISLKYKIDGVIATNTSISRPKSLKSTAYINEQGGLSGGVIAPLSDKVISELSKHLQDKIPIIGCGGVTDKTSAESKLKAGAKLLQVYTGFIYRGVDLIDDIL